MEPLNQLKRRSTDLFKQAQQNMPSLPRSMNMDMSSVPGLPHLPKSLPSLSQLSFKNSKAAAAVQGTWQRIDIPALPRSSHSVNVVAGSAYIFGGEIEARQPVDNDMHIIRLPSSSAGADYYRVEARAAAVEPDTAPAQTANLDEVALEEEEEGPKGKGKETATDARPRLGDVPAARVGHATAVIGSRIFLFGGRGGPDMKPLEEAGRVWVYDTRSHAWSHLDPVPAVKGGAIIPQPSPRSYHCATASDRPRDFPEPGSSSAAARKPQTWRQWALGDTSKTGIPQDPVVGYVAEQAVDAESDGYGTFFVHAGCLASGDRTSDLWAFDVRARTWTELPAAPGPSRGGAAICISKSRLFRFGGYDGEAEVGGQLDFLHLEVETFDDGASRGERRRRRLARRDPVLAMGERAPSADGHDAAGAFLDDVWTFEVPPLGMTAASVRAAFLQAVGKKTGEGRWQKVSMAEYDDESGDGVPAARGWIASAPLTDLEESGIMIWGGLGADNKRIGDGWILRLGKGD
ncbi:kelch domain-containing protein [Metarhizium guizhouense ARSEF 977]|uniref:Kelch domain-containing protein n=1 Tax=Metarhizium guizhouense (strain ARSEF 977) TaxID=1276136 RepID=A0A0B4H744_METGA|nr:kelch domain-containing protein [Metarhizium guizhouense ARSEF 977]